MADAIILAAFLGVIALVVIVLLVKDDDETDRPEKLDKGDWVITERNVGFGATGVFVVRSNGGRINNNTSILVGKIRDDAPDWTDRYEELMALARQRQASLQGNK